MCIFTNDKDIPGHVRLSTRTLQYLIIPLLSLALLIVGQCQSVSVSLQHILVSIITIYSPLLTMGVDVRGCIMYIWFKILGKLLLILYENFQILDGREKFYTKYIKYILDTLRIFQNSVSLFFIPSIPVS